MLKKKLHCQSITFKKYVKVDHNLTKYFVFDLDEV